MLVLNIVKMVSHSIFLICSMPMQVVFVLSFLPLYTSVILKRKYQVILLSNWTTLATLWLIHSPEVFQASGSLLCSRDLLLCAGLGLLLPVNFRMSSPLHSSAPSLLVLTGLANSKAPPTCLGSAVPILTRVLCSSHTSLFFQFLYTHLRTSAQPGPFTWNATGPCSWLPKARIWCCL